VLISRLQKAQFFDDSSYWAVVTKLELLIARESLDRLGNLAIIFKDLKDHPLNVAGPHKCLSRQDIVVANNYNSRLHLIYRCKPAKHENKVSVTFLGENDVQPSKDMILKSQPEADLETLSIRVYSSPLDP
jgi:hypothetical protein